MKHFFIYILAFYALACVYIITRGWQALERLPYLRAPYLLIALVLVVSPVLIFTLDGILPYKIMSPMYVIAYSWIILFIYLLLLTIFFDIARLLFIKTHLVQGFFVQFYDKTKMFVFLAVIIFTALVALGGYIKFINPDIVKYEIKSEKLKFPEKKIVFVSDLHLGYVVSKTDARRFVDLINGQNPDIVLIGGDLIDRSIPPLFEQKLYEEMSQIKAKEGVFAVLGNHESFSKNDSLILDFYKRCNITLLKDENVLLDNNISIFGREDFTNKNRLPVDAIAKNLDNQYFNIIIDHQPTEIDEISKKNTDLLLCGHTHGGQIFPGNLIVKKLFKLAHGKKKFNNSEVIVSSGLGLWGGKFRVGTSSELIVIDLTNDKLQ
jgi:predicted MPP superfamily phosphohydrolase